MVTRRIEPGFLKGYYEKEANSTYHQSVYVKGSAWTLHYHCTRLKEISCYLALAPGGIFLDVGCAEGLYVGVFRKLHPNSICVGVDISRGYLRKAKNRVMDAHWVLADAQNLPFRHEIFDFILCSEVLEHLPNARRCFKELVRTSKSHFLVSFPLVSPYRTLATRLNFFRELKDPFYVLCSGHITALNLEDIENWSQEMSCVVKEVKALCFMVPEKIATKLRIPDFLCSLISAVDRFISHMVNGRIKKTSLTPDCTIVALLKKTRVLEVLTANMSFNPSDKTENLR